MWTAKSKQGYIGITAHFFNQDFIPVDAFFTIEYLLYPHIENAISTFIESIINNFNLSDKLGCIITDNDSNMKCAISLLNEKFNKI